VRSTTQGRTGRNGPYAGNAPSLLPEDRARIAAFMKQLASRLTVLVVEHAMDVVLSISDHIVVMHQGRLLAQGTPEEIRANAQVQEAYLGGQHVLA
jgi:ABC-type branched-subunit amino acid transport system ATPase component